jgi:hypothetical protein
MPIIILCTILHSLLKASVIFNNADNYPVRRYTQFTHTIGVFF